jgi:hypothetical protein
MTSIPLRDDGMAEDGRNPMWVAAERLLEQDQKDQELLQRFEDEWPEISREMAPEDREFGANASRDLKLIMARRFFS